MKSALKTPSSDFELQLVPVFSVYFVLFVSSHFFEKVQILTYFGVSICTFSRLVSYD